MNQKVLFLLSKTLQEPALRPTAAMWKGALAIPSMVTFKKWRFFLKTAEIFQHPSFPSPMGKSEVNLELLRP